MIFKSIDLILINFPITLITLLQFLNLFILLFFLSLQIPHMLQYPHFMNFILLSLVLILTYFYFLSLCFGLKLIDILFEFVDYVMVFSDFGVFVQNLFLHLTFAVHLLLLF